MLNLSQEKVQANLERMLFLVIDNEKTSASRSGLIRQNKNNAEIKTMLSVWLDIGDDDADDLYWGRANDL